jgi:hypothetical protein
VIAAFIENAFMKSIEKSIVDAADGDAVVESFLNGTPLDPETAHRVDERGDAITERLRRKYGILDVRADLVRAVRDEE